MYQATIRVTGTGRIEEFRERVRVLMVQDADAVEYTEHHADGALEYRFEGLAGLPFPAFALVSGDFPELRVEAQWADTGRGVRGSAVIENGKVSALDSAPHASDAVSVAVQVGAQVELEFALACAQTDAGWLGYCATSTRHAYVHLAGDHLRIAEGAGARWTGSAEADAAFSADDAPIEDTLLSELERLAFDFAGAWLWFDESREPAAMLERKRYTDHGWPVRGANLRTERVLSIGSELTFVSLAEGARVLHQRLQRHWVESA